MIRKTVLFLMAGTLMTACDDGKIYDDGLSGPEQEGLTVELSASVTGSGSYGEDYSVAFAAFASGSDYAAVSKGVGDGDVSVSISGVPGDVATVELCLLNRLRKRVATFAGVDVSGHEGKVVLEAGAVDAGMWTVVQREVFDRSCAQCHGGSTGAAAGLNLTAGNSYAALVGVESAMVPGARLVDPGNAAGSVLWRAVATELSDDWRFRHVGIIVPDMQNFIKDWIDIGAVQ